MSLEFVNEEQKTDDRFIKLIERRKLDTTEQYFAMNVDYYRGVRAEVCLTNDAPISLASFYRIPCRYTLVDAVS